MVFQIGDYVIENLRDVLIYLLIWFLTTVREIIQLISLFIFMAILPLVRHFAPLWLSEDIIEVYILSYPYQPVAVFLFAIFLILLYVRSQVLRFHTYLRNTFLERRDREHQGEIGITMMDAIARYELLQEEMRAIEHNFARLTVNFHEQHGENNPFVGIEAPANVADENESSKKGVPAEGVPVEGVSGKGVSGKGVSGKGVSGKGVSGKGVSGEGVSGEGVPAEGVSTEGVPAEGVSAEEGACE